MTRKSFWIAKANSGAHQTPQLRATLLLFNVGICINVILYRIQHISLSSGRIPITMVYSVFLLYAAINSIWVSAFAPISCERCMVYPRSRSTNGNSVVQPSMGQPASLPHSKMPNQSIFYSQMSTRRSAISLRTVIATVLHHNPDDHHVAMAGTIWPILQKVFTAPMKVRLIWHNIVSISEWQECILFPFLAFALMPIAKFYYKRIQHRHTRSMESMKRFSVVAFIEQISKVALSVYVVDVISITLTSIGFAFAKEWKIADVYAKLACTYVSCCCASFTCE